MTWMHGYRELLEKEAVEAWRTYRFALVSVLFVMVGIGVPVLVRFLPRLTRFFGLGEEELGIGPQGVGDVVDFFVRNLVLLGGLSGLLLAMGSVAEERRRGTLALVLSRPVSRAAFVWAKFVGLGMILGFATGLAVLAAWLYTTLLFEAPPVLPWLQLGLVAWLSTMVYVAVTLLGSVVAGSSLGAAAIGLVFLAAMSLASTVSTLARWLPTGLAEIARTVALEEPSQDLVPAATIAVSIGVIAGSLLLAWLRLRKAEI